MNALTINGNIELVYELNDVSKIIRKYFNSELADEMDKMIEDNKEQLNKANEYDACYVEELEEIIEEIRRLVG